MRIEIYLLKIRTSEINDACKPHFDNHSFTSLDAIELYLVIALKRPRAYEIGSGNSTKFVKKAFTDYRTDTEIISIDRNLSAEIDQI